MRTICLSAAILGVCLSATGLSRVASAGEGKEAGFEYVRYRNIRVKRLDQSK